MSEVSHHRHDGSVEERSLPVRSPVQMSTTTPARTPAPRLPLNPMNINAILSSPIRDPQATKPTPFRHAGTKRSISSLDEEEYSRYSPRPPPFGPLLQPSPYRAPALPHIAQAWNMTPLPPIRAGPLPPLQGFPAFPSPTHARTTPVNVPSIRSVMNEPVEAVQKDDCDEIRQRIREYLEGGDMRVTEFQRTLNINSNSYSRFMKMTGPTAGQDNQTYTAAKSFFRQRDVEQSRTSSARSSSGGNDSIFTALSASTQSTIPQAPAYPLTATPHPAKRARTSTGSTVSAASRFSPASTTATTPPASSSTSLGVPDISHITLPGMTTDNVLVYDSCDAIRAKITAHLALPGISQASFLRTLAAQFHAEERKFQSKQLNTFRQYSGADKGNTSAIFYAAYVFFERVRIAKGEGKSQHRLDMENIWPNGFQTKTPGPSQRGLFSGPGEAWHVDSFGRYVFADGRVGTW